MSIAATGSVAGPPGKHRLGTAVRYLSAPAAVTVAALLKWWLEASVGPLPTFIIFYPAILAVASIGGGGPGVLATLLSSAVAIVWYFPPTGQLYGKAPNSILALLLFAVFNLLLCVLAERLRRTRWAAAVSAAQREDLALLDMGNVLFLDPEYRIVHWSQGCRRLYGFEAGEALGRVAQDLFQTRFPQPLEEVRRARLQQGYWEGELTRRRKDGTEIVVAVLWTLRRDEKGRPSAILEVSNDITDRKRAEESLQRTAEELRRSNSDLEQFAYVASHDLQEPLRMVAGFVQLLQRQYASRLDADADKYIDFAVDGAKRMQTLINDLLAYSRVGTRGQERAPTDSAAALDCALANLRSSIDETAARITHGELPTVRADQVQLVQLFQNLVGNALKFRGQSPPKIHVDATRQDDHWRFSVSDNGIGIDPQFQQRIFLIFQRLHTREHYPGTGIGLAICKKIVDRHGGRIWVESQAGRGATFYFTFPT
jgi:PAS domain S-box-containing protein